MRGTPYPTLGELLRRARATVTARPGVLRLRVVGTSRAGRPLWLLSAGHGPRHILTVAAQPEFPPVASDPRPAMPESEALVRLLDELRPVVQFSLHGVEVGGSFLQLTRALPGAAAAYRRIAADLGIPLEHRPFDGMGWLAESLGVLVLLLALALV